MSLTDIMSAAGLAFYPTVALVLFFVVFVALGVRLIYSLSGDVASEIGKIPLRDDEPTTNDALSPRRVS